VRKFLSFLVFIGIVCALGYFYLNYKAEKKEERIEIEQRKKELEDLRKQEEEEARILKRQEYERQQKILEERKKRQEFLSGRRGSTSLAIPTPLPTRNTQNQTGFRYKSMVESACREAGCTLVKYQETGNSSYIVVEGPDHSTVSNVLDPLVRAGMKDFTDHKDQFKAEMINGRRVYTAAYTIKW
jgi:predicted Holliday junction resolvase-like endonuclease